MQKELSQFFQICEKPYLLSKYKNNFVVYAFCKIIPMFTKVKDYEDIVAKKEQKETRKGLTPELIAQIEEEVLGITPNDRTSEEN